MSEKTPPAVYDETKKGLSIAALVISIAGLFLSLTIIGLIGGLVSGSISIICMKKKQGLKGLLLASLILAIIDIGIFILLLGMGFYQHYGFLWL